MNSECERGNAEGESGGGEGLGAGEGNNGQGSNTVGDVRGCAEESLRDAVGLDGLLVGATTIVAAESGDSVGGGPLGLLPGVCLVSSGNGATGCPGGAESVAVAVANVLHTSSSLHGGSGDATSSSSPSGGGEVVGLSPVGGSGGSGNLGGGRISGARLPEDEMADGEVSIGGDGGGELGGVIGSEGSSAGAAADVSTVRDSLLATGAVNVIDGGEEAEGGDNLVTVSGGEGASVGGGEAGEHPGGGETVSCGVDARRTRGNESGSHKIFSALLTGYIL